MKAPSKIDLNKMDDLLKLIDSNTLPHTLVYLHQAILNLNHHIPSFRLYSNLIIIFRSKISIFLEYFMKPCLHTMLAAAKRVTVTVKETIHISTFDHLDQNRCELSLQCQQSLEKANHYVMSEIWKSYTDLSYSSQSC